MPVPLIDRVPDDATRRIADSEAAPSRIAIEAPAVQNLPFVYASPHSGRDYSETFLAASRLDPVTIRRSEDSFIDEVFAAAPECGAPLLKALFPRAYCDPNREPYELDPAMFAEPLPDFVNTTSVRVAGGLGTLARVVANGCEIYARKLSFAEAERRVRDCYNPYHRALARLLSDTRARFGFAVVVDCHSMPSIGGPMDQDDGDRRADIVLGDRYGTACAPALTDHAARALTDLGYRVARNAPYAGGHTTVRYGQPERGYHALQIEINRALYMDEERIERLPALGRLAADMTRLIERLGAMSHSLLLP
ncbi:N-formylglutamate amidohydrolase [Oceanibacterium hippocampi]|uniref:N-formylglutamate amidohydrolase n=1 Tax=Oceanibacterium hippocampi TaxID=745714 RepID=A0A1Y5SB04_9PROT|nr:N-formylglutamate amidohydrolase [Oceanibacterium hippocampi]SLN35018.1 N-formylglutamate amidohydrolase [Oceanibacterium hippocampi]